MGRRPFFLEIGAHGHSADQSLATVRVPNVFAVDIAGVAVTIQAHEDLAMSSKSQPKMWSLALIMRGMVDGVVWVEHCILLILVNGVEMDVIVALLVSSVNNVVSTEVSIDVVSIIVQLLRRHVVLMVGMNRHVSQDMAILVWDSMGRDWKMSKRRLRVVCRIWVVRDSHDIGSGEWHRGSNHAQQRCKEQTHRKEEGNSAHVAEFYVASK